MIERREPEPEPVAPEPVRTTLTIGTAIIVAMIAGMAAIAAVALSFSG